MSPPLTHQLRLRVNDVANLFNAIDANPLQHKHLDPEIETFIENWARNLPRHARIRLTVHLAQQPQQLDSDAVVTSGVQHHFEAKAAHIRTELQHLLQEGRVSLLIGVVFLSLCLLASQAIGQYAGGTGIAVMREGLAITGWVAMWRPMQIFLYDWWPLARRIRVCKALGHAVVRIHLPGSPEGASLQ